MSKRDGSNKNPLLTSNNSNKMQSIKENQSGGGNSGYSDRFEETHAKNIAAAKNFVKDYASSSEDEEELDEKTILDSVYRHYEPHNDSKLLKKTAAFLENLLNSGASCLICIGSIRRMDAIWSCKLCYCFFHLNCIQRWAKDSIAQLKVQVNQEETDQGHYNHLGEYVQPKRARALRWCCPQCRSEYEPADRPTNYECFCGKEANPQPQPWIVPHSCGEVCGKQLQPECGHKCMLLCHPGPCPPCAQYANVSCLCGKSAPTSIRCVEKNWQCAQKCRKRLSCGKHVCSGLCHKPDQCPPCTSTSLQPCECGNETVQRSCSDLKWHCRKLCGSKYSCDIHVCKKVCHAGPCGECPLSLPRSCPCGKTSKVGPCTDVIDTCGDTCQKLLPCGIHTCTQRCHRGECNLCLVITKKKCRCGKHEKEFPCCKHFICDTKCKQIRDCGKHACNKKCCDGRCPPCDKICGKPLLCKKHKCQSVCHEGPCYPCKLVSQVNCRCGKTSRDVPCGRERTARVVCLEPCRIPSKCHHAIKHRCHKHECPPCSQKCGLPNDTSGCGHLCEAKCHAAVKVLQKSVASSPSLWTQNKKFEYRTLPHRQCEKMVTVTCIGGHEVAEWPCWNSKPSSCQRKCGRFLHCGNHKCELVCHAVPDIQDTKEQTGCAPCQMGCQLPRPPGCTHPCPRACHLPPCAICSVNIKSKCHCGLTQVIYKCSEFYNDEGTELEISARRERFKSCGNRCLNNFPCGHRCLTPCHSGQCPNPELCRKKVRLFCDCKRLKLEVSCDKHRTGLHSLKCDEHCLKARHQLAETLREEAEQLRLAEEAIRRAELDQFEKKFGKRKHRERKTVAEQVTRKVNLKVVSIYACLTVAILLAVALAFYEER